MKKKETKIIGYKGFDKDLKCRDTQYEPNKEYQVSGEPELCAKGFHFCENPLDVLNFYPLKDGNRFTGSR